MCAACLLGRPAAARACWRLGACSTQDGGGSCQHPRLFHGVQHNCLHACSRLKVPHTYLPKHHHRAYGKGRLHIGWLQCRAHLGSGQWGTAIALQWLAAAVPRAQCAACSGWCTTRVWTPPFLPVVCVFELLTFWHECGCWTHQRLLTAVRLPARCMRVRPITHGEDICPPAHACASPAHRRWPAVDMTRNTCAKNRFFARCAAVPHGWYQMCQIPMCANKERSRRCRHCHECHLSMRISAPSRVCVCTGLFVYA